MSLRKNRWPLWPIGLAAALATGCGGPAGDWRPAAPPDAATGLRVLQENGAAARVPADHGRRFLARLGLTPGQRARLREIKADWPKTDAARLTGASEEFKEILRGDPLNPQALGSLLTTVLSGYDAKATRRAAVADKARDVLTPAQRQQVAVALLAHLNGPAERPADAPDLALTAEQKAAFAWTKDLSKARRMAALASFMLTGDDAALTAAWTVRATPAQVARMVAAIAAMTSDQREALIVAMEQAHAGLIAAHAAMQ